MSLEKTHMSEGYLFFPLKMIKPASRNIYCQTLGLVLRLRVDFVLPLSQEQQQEEEEEEEEEPLTKIFQWGVY